MKRLLLLSVLLLSGFWACGATYRPADVPNVQRADRNRYVSNPDGILSASAVARLDSLCGALRGRGLAQVAVVAVDDIAGGDTFSFAIELFGSWGVGSAKSDNGLGVLLVRDLHEIRFITGGGLEGILPDALCKRIQMKYMLPAFRQEDYDAGMLAGLAVTAEVLAGGTPDLSEPEGELSGGAILAIVGLVVGLLLALGILNYYRSRRCPHCRRFTLRQHSVEQVALTRTYREMEYTYVCSSCGATVRRRVRSERGNRFGAPDMLATRLSEGTCETCNTYNMLKLTRHLFQYDPAARYADYYERALYNQILPSQNPDDGMVCYMSPLGSGCRKTFSLPFDSFWCCVGSGMENHARYGEFIYFFGGDDNLFVNLYVPSTLDWQSRGIRLEQQTEFPRSDEIRFRISAQAPERFVLHLRCPSWAAGHEVAVNGRTVRVEPAAAGYLAIDRRWRDGDEVRLTLRRTLRSEAVPGDSALRAYLYGPVVLSAVLDDREEIPVLVTDRVADAPSLVRCTDAAKLRFETRTAQPVQKELIPYFEVGGRRMMVYFRHLPTATWQDRLAALRMQEDREAWLRERTVSQFTPGEMQPERDHGFRGTNTQPHEFEGRKYRETLGGWFSFDMAIDPGQPNTLYCTYWGNRFYNHSFDIEVDGVKVGFENIHNWGARYVERSYPIPAELTSGREKVTVTLRAIRGDAVAGPLFDCRIMR